jgi:hypothetical protein
MVPSTTRRSPGGNFVAGQGHEIPGARERTGYRVGIRTREAFGVVGYTLVVPPGSGDEIPAFWDAVIEDGRLAALRSCSSTPPWVLGLGSWDPECERGGQRYTICIEETEHTDVSRLEAEHALFRTTIGASDWMCFGLTHGEYCDHFWEDERPYRIIPALGYAFNMSAPNVGLHFDAYPPDSVFPLPAQAPMGFWITVVRP